MHLVCDREGLLPESSAGYLELRRLKLKRTWQLTACLLQIINGSLPTGSTISITTSGGFRNSERGVQSLAREARRQIFGLPRPLSVTLEVRTEYLEATLGLVSSPAYFSHAEGKNSLVNGLFHFRSVRFKNW